MTPAPAISIFFKLTLTFYHLAIHLTDQGIRYGCGFVTWPTFLNNFEKALWDIPV